MLGVNGFKEEPSPIKVRDSKFKPVFSVHQVALLFCVTLSKHSHSSIMVVCIAKLIFILFVVYGVRVLLVNVYWFQFLYCVRVIDVCTVA